MKRLFLLLIFLASAVCADDYFPVGFWQPPEKVDEAFFKTLADGNFTLVFSNLGNQFKNLDMAKAAGMKEISSRTLRRRRTTSPPRTRTTPYSPTSAAPTLPKVG